MFLSLKKKKGLSVQRPRYSRTGLESAWRVQGLGLNGPRLIRVIVLILHLPRRYKKGFVKTRNLHPKPQTPNPINPKPQTGVHTKNPKLLSFTCPTPRVAQTLNPPYGTLQNS